MATFGTDKSKSIQTGAIKQETLVDETAGSEAAAFGKGFADLGKTAITFFDDKAKKGVKDSFSINQAALQTLATRKEQGRIGKLPGLDDTDRTPDQIRDARIDLLIRDNLGNNVSDKIVGDTRKRFDLIAAASAKGGGLTQTDLGVIINSDLKLMMRDNPGFEEVIREQATKSLGFDPTHSPMKQALAILAPKAETIDPDERTIQSLARNVYNGDVDAARNHFATKKEGELVAAQVSIKSARNEASQADAAVVASASMSNLSSIFQQEFERRRGLGFNSGSVEAIDADTKYVRSYFASAISEQNKLAAQNGIDVSKTVDNLMKQEERFLTQIKEGSMTDFLNKKSEHNKAVLQMGVESNAKMFAAQSLFGDEYMGTFYDQFNAVKDDPKRLKAAQENFPKFRATLAYAKQMEGYLDSEFRMREGKPASGTGEDQKVDIENVDMVLNGQTTKDANTLTDLKYLDKEYGTSTVIKSFSNTTYEKLKESGKTDTIKYGQTKVAEEADALLALYPTLSKVPGIVVRVGLHGNILFLDKRKEQLAFTAPLGGQLADSSIANENMRSLKNYVVRANNLLRASNNLDSGKGDMSINPAILIPDRMPKKEVTAENVFK